MARNLKNYNTILNKNLNCSNYFHLNNQFLIGFFKYILCFKTNIYYMIMYLKLNHALIRLTLSFILLENDITLIIGNLVK